MTVAKGGGGEDGLGGVVLGGLGGGLGIVSQDETAEEGAGEGAAGAVG